MSFEGDTIQPIMVTISAGIRTSKCCLMPQVQEYEGREWVNKWVPVSAFPIINPGLLGENKTQCKGCNDQIR